VDVFPEREAKILGRSQVEGIDQRYAQRVITDGNRQSAVQSRQAARNHSQYFRSDIVFC
jgi:hypothetical protein